MSSWDEEMLTMMGGLAAVAVFCIAALLVGVTLLEGGNNVAS